MLAVGSQEFRDPVGLEARDGRRPDLQLVVNLRYIIATWLCRTRSDYSCEAIALRPWGLQLRCSEEARERRPQHRTCAYLCIAPYVGSNAKQQDPTQTIAQH